ncbi:MAG TPA: cache domain-containing protein, partial [Azonexus sp.]|nr:cache domain-containing protein [Azonexus sp.]
MQLLVGLTLLGLIILCLTALFQLKGSMLEDRKQKTRNLVEVSLGIVAHHHQLAAAGKLSEEDAKKAARDSLRGLRYGKDDYFFGFETSGVYVLNGGNPATEGQNKIDLKDTNGKFLVKELIAAAQAGGGFVDYWFPRAGQQVAEPKLGYAALFAP